MNKKKWLLLLGITVVLIFMILVMLPTRITRTDKVFNADGLEKEITLDLSLCRFAGEEKISGCIWYDGEEYVHVKDVYGEKWEGKSNYFIIPERYALDALENFIILDAYDKQLNSYVVIIKTADGTERYKFEK